MRPTINEATSARRKSSKKRLVYSKSMPTITFKLNYFLIRCEARAEGSSVARLINLPG